MQKDKYKLALVGKEISHSKSPEIYRKILGREIDYKLLDYESDIIIPSLDELFKNLDGLSITSPYKQHFIPQVKVDLLVKDLGVINCIRKSNSAPGEYEATNTDLTACKVLLPGIIDQHSISKVVILGDGAMATIIKKAMAETSTLGHLAYFRKKDGDITNLNLSNYSDVLIINCCSRSFIFEGKIAPFSVYWNLNYNQPAQEDLISSQNCTYIDGLSLLELQARHALSFWNIR